MRWGAETGSESARGGDERELGVEEDGDGPRAAGSTSLSEGGKYTDAAVVYCFSSDDDDASRTAGSPSASTSAAAADDDDTGAIRKDTSPPSDTTPATAPATAPASSPSPQPNVDAAEFDADAVDAAATAVEAALAASAPLDTQRARELEQSPSFAPDATVPALAPAQASATPRAGAVHLAAVAVKEQLLDAFYGANRGLSASGRVRVLINELVTRLEAYNPTPSPTQEMDTLGGTWRLVYTSNSELLVLLAADNLPGFAVGDMTQTIDGNTATVENRVVFSAPLVETSLSARASFEVKSPKRLKVTFNKAGIETPTLVDQSLFVFPASVDVLGQSVDTAAMASVLEPLQQAAFGVLGALGGVIKKLPGIAVSLPEGTPAGSQAWLMTTYLDPALRIARGDGGSIFIFTKMA